MSELFKWTMAVVFVLTYYSLFFSTDSNTVPEVISHHWKNDCRLLETNIDKGFFSPAQNRLQCGDVIENVSKSDYDRAMSGDKQTTLAEAMKEIFIR
ncbi:TPA: hypothetical protein MAL10_004239 [Klebsiella pneumoniae]|mgnify:FL=1|uniref:Uncharacterized protein n=1 Tax=Klebsiella pneumoniae TaxID=573 RepID=A0A2L1KT34_KLEPN|nr:hypothetical protein [Klebsiella pneumoniae]ANF12338.1 hypothetical protein A7321_26170 [Klebsiella pneumoniae]ANN55183.1 hypothetical protein BAU11_26365 [Klebsiella pneumoniae]AVE25660.1 hypothetical protein INF167p1_00086 [Klebsiella pneumoniae]MBD7066349.1 hypothetical protein [Klebsiella pneumoniae]MBE0110009.1 hypothetical protein [Klebsiella pneumoniae]